MPSNIGNARPAGMAERFNAPVLKTEMAPRENDASLVEQRIEPNETEALRIKKWQQIGNRKWQNGLLPDRCQIRARTRLHFHGGITLSSIRKNAYSSRSAHMPRFSSTSRIYRIDVPAGSFEGTLRMVVIVEIPESVISALKNSSPRLQTRAYEVAMDITRSQRFNDPNVSFQGWTNTVLLDANLTDYGKPDRMAEDGCRAWIIEKP
jgi:hypothetical protein